MDGWRIAATALLVVAGIVLVMLTMARTRDRKNATSGQVAVNGAIALTVLVVLCVLTLTVLSVVPALIVTGVVVIAVGVMMLAS